MKSLPTLSCLLIAGALATSPLAHAQLQSMPALPSASSIKASAATATAKASASVGTATALASLGTDLKTVATDPAVVTALKQANDAVKAALLKQHPTLKALFDANPAVAANLVSLGSALTGTVAPAK